MSYKEGMIFHTLAGRGLNWSRQGPKGPVRHPRGQLGLRREVWGKQIHSGVTSMWTALMTVSWGGTLVPANGMIQRHSLTWEPVEGNLE